MAKQAQTLTRDQIEQRVRRIIEDNLGVDESEITLQSTLRDDLGADSLDDVELIMACEEEFDLEISDEDAEKIHTVKDVMDYVARRLKVG